MEIKKVKISGEDKYRLFPPGIRSLLERDQTRIYGALEGERLLGTALLCERTDPGGGCIICHLEAFPGAPENTARRLMLHMEDICRTAGIKELAVKLVGDEGTHLDHHEMLLSMSYRPLSLSSHYLVYYLDGLLDTSFIDRLPDLESVKDNVKILKELSNSQIDIFSEKLRKKGKYTDLKNLDRHYCRFYVIDNEVQGFLNAKKLSDKALYADDCYVARPVKAAYAIPAMLAAVLARGSRKMPGDTVFIMELSEESLYVAIREVFGTPESDQRVFEYIREL